MPDDIELAKRRLDDAGRVMDKIQAVMVANATAAVAKDEVPVSFTLEEFEFLIASVMLTHTALQKGIEVSGKAH